MKTNGFDKQLIVETANSAEKLFDLFSPVRVGLLRKITRPPNEMIYMSRIPFIQHRTAASLIVYVPHIVRKRLKIGQKARRHGQVSAFR